MRFQKGLNRTFFSMRPAPSVGSDLHPPRDAWYTVVWCSNTDREWEDQKSSRINGCLTNENTDVPGTKNINKNQPNKITSTNAVENK